VTEHRAPYPVRVDGTLEPRASRGLWLVKWLLLIPHYVVLFFLWIAFLALGVVVFFAILITGRYPRAIFDFDVGVLRWTWRVSYYGYGALGTDRYPPFTLADVRDYPARLDVDYPERLSRGLVLVKWWLLAIPHYLVLAVFIGGGVWLGTRPGHDTGWDSGWDSGWAVGGLVGLLVFIAGVVLLFTGRYPHPIYDFVMGMDRWVFRVMAYVGLMTDAYPPFRLDLGGPDPGSVPAGPPLPPAPAPAAAAPQAAGGPAPTGPGSSWTGGRVVSVVLGGLLLFAASGFLLGGGTLLWADQTQRNDGYVWTEHELLATPGYAVLTEDVQFDTGGEQWLVDDVLGTARIEVTPTGDGEVFVGVAPTAAVREYLSGVRHATVDEFGQTSGRPATTEIGGGAPGSPPAEVDIWTSSASGTGTQVVDWRPADGNWTAVVMRADGAAGVAVDARAGATLPGLTWLSVVLLITGGVLLVGGALLVALAVHRAHRAPPPGPMPGVPGPRRPEGSRVTT
jgi:hypothetical protein